MQFDTAIGLRDVLTIIAMIGSILWSIFKVGNMINQKADKNVVERISENLLIISHDIELSNKKLDELKIENGKKVDEIKTELKKHEDKYNQLYHDFTIVETEHKKNHK